MLRYNAESKWNQSIARKVATLIRLGSPSFSIGDEEAKQDEQWAQIFQEWEVHAVAH